MRARARGADHVRPSWLWIRRRRTPQARRSDHLWLVWKRTKAHGSFRWPASVLFPGVHSFSAHALLLFRLFRPGV